ncbi:MAG: rod shape-determining protein MreD [Rhodobacteraceae bacterium]|nr:rod shape-determining protein MreD [Paracoccaceae bacterium]
MVQPALQRIDTVARHFVPFGVTIFLLLFGLTPTHIPGFAPVSPMLTLMAVYFWAVYRPDAIGYGFAFAVGVVEDLLTGTPLGSSALVLMLCQWIVFRQQKFFNARPFFVVWLAFCLVALGAALLRWLAVGLFSESGFVTPDQALMSAVMSMAIYPIIGWLLAKAHLKLMVQP